MPQSARLRLPISAWQWSAEMLGSCNSVPGRSTTLNRESSVGSSAGSFKESMRCESKRWTFKLLDAATVVARRSSWSRHLYTRSRTRWDDWRRSNSKLRPKVMSHPARSSSSLTTEASRTSSTWITPIRPRSRGRPSNGYQYSDDSRRPRRSSDHAAEGRRAADRLLACNEIRRLSPLRWPVLDAGGQSARPSAVGRRRVVRCRSASGPIPG